MIPAPRTELSQEARFTRELRELEAAVEHLLIAKRSLLLADAEAEHLLMVKYAARIRKLKIRFNAAVM